MEPSTGSAGYRSPAGAQPRTSFTSTSSSSPTLGTVEVELLPVYLVSDRARRADRGPYTLRTLHAVYTLAGPYRGRTCVIGSLTNDVYRRLLFRLHVRQRRPAACRSSSCSSSGLIVGVRGGALVPCLLLHHLLLGRRSSRSRRRRDRMRLPRHRPAESARHARGEPPSQHRLLPPSELLLLLPLRHRNPATIASSTMPTSTSTSILFEKDAPLQHSLIELLQVTTTSSATSTSTCRCGGH